MVTFTVEDLRTPERLERVLQQFNRALYAPLNAVPVSTSAAPVDLNNLVKRLAPILSAQLQAPGIAPINLQSLLPSSVLRDTSANRATLYPAANYPAGTLFFETDTSFLYIVSDSSGSNQWVAIGTVSSVISITGTANQVIVTGTTSVVLSLPQNIHTAATPQFARLGLGAAADATAQLYIAADGTQGLARVRSAASFGNYELYRSGGTIASPSNVANGDIIGTLRTLAYSGATGFWNVAQINFAVDGVVTDNQRPGSRFEFYTNTPNGAQTLQLQINGDGTILLTAKITKYNNIATVGSGVPAIYGSGRSTAQTAAVASVAAYTNGAADGSFLVSANVNITTSTTFNFTVTVTYTDETNTSRTLTLSFFALSGGAPISSITNVTGAGPYEGCPVHLRVKASTAITIATTGTFTSVTYNVEGYITQIG